MHPVLFAIGKANFYSLSFLVGVGFFLTSFIVWRRFKDIGLGEELALDLILTSCFLGFLVSRVFFFVSHMDKNGLNPLNWFLANKYPGFSFLGLVFGIFLSLFIFSKLKRMSFFKLTDEIVYALLPFLITLQVGLFFDGSGFGKPTAMPWGLYTPDSLIKRQPISLFMAFLLFLLWLFLLQIERNWRSWDWYKAKKEGLVTLFFLALVSFSNLALAFLRENSLYWYVAEIALSAVAFLASVIFIIKFSGPQPKKVRK